MIPYRIPELATKYIAYDMIHRYTGLPPFSEARTRLLYAVLAVEPTAAEHSELYALVVGLLQLGLDTHDWIDTARDAGTEAEMRSRQMKVLGGDYFSGRFYHLLAQAGQRERIHKLSEAVCEINRLKMDHYVDMQQAQMDSERYIGYGVAQRSALLLAFADLVSGETAKRWQELVETVSRAELLAAELDRLHDEVGFHWGLGYWMLLEEQRADGRGESVELHPAYRASAYGRLCDELRRAVALLHDEADRLPDERLADELHRIGEFLLTTLAVPAPAFNETR